MFIYLLITCDSFNSVVFFLSNLWETNYSGRKMLMETYIMVFMFTKLKTEM